MKPSTRRDIMFTPHRDPITLFSVMLFMALLLSPLPGLGGVFAGDEDITAQVEREMRYDAGIDPADIDVITENGMVTLQGTVPALPVERRALYVAETVRGVQTVVDRLDVKPEVQLPGDALRGAIRDELDYDAATDGYDIEVTANDAGLVELKGRVETWAQHALIESVVRGVAGITRIQNHITVDAKDDFDDADIIAEIQQRLYRDERVDGRLIDVRSNNGKVRLSGTVTSAAEKRVAAQLAGVSGVTEVDHSALQVAQWERGRTLVAVQYPHTPDTDIRQAIYSTLALHPRIYAFELDVAVTNGLVELRGEVDNVQAKRAAVRAAQNTTGVIAVSDFIRVQPADAGDSHALQDDLAAALKRNPCLTADGIELHVNDRTARLEGSVDSFFDKAEAEYVVSRARGIAAIENNIQVRNPGIQVHDPFIDRWSIDNHPWYPRSKSALDTDVDNGALEQRIREEFQWSPFIDDARIEVFVENGTAVLSGTVSTRFQYDRARHNAYEGGAVEVDNRIVVIKGARIMEDIGPHGR